MALPPHAPFVLLAAIVGSSVAFFAWVYRDAPGARPLAGFMVAASCWALAEGIALASPTFGGKVFWTRVVWTVSPLVPLAWLATVFAHAPVGWRLTRRRAGLLSLEPLAFAALVWTNDRHGLVWADFSTAVVDGYVVLGREFGLAFWAHAAYSYLLVAVGGAVLVWLSLRTSRPFRNQSTALLAAAVVPMSANALSVFGVVPPQYDLTSVGFVVTGVVVAVAMVSDDLLSVSPVTRELGREAVVDEIDDPVVIADDADRVVDCNPAAERLFDVDAGVVGDPLSAVCEPLADAVAGVEAGQVSLELPVGETVRHYDVRVSSLRRAYGAVGGRVVALRDVTERRRREQHLDVLNRLLRHNLRNEMNVVRGNAELLAAHLDGADPDVADRIENIQRTVDTVVERSDKVGHLSGTLDAAPTGTVPLATVVGDAAETVADRTPAATIDVDVPEGVSVADDRSLELAVEELLRNAVEHNDRPSPTVEVTAERDGGAVELSVADDGPGIADQERAVIEEGRETALEHGSGVGLWLVAWAVREHGGSVSFESDGDGTTVYLCLPTGEDAPDATATSAESGHPDAETTDGDRRRGGDR